MAAGASGELAGLYNELNKACNGSVYAKVVTVANKILVKKPNDIKVLHCKIVALIHSEKYEECVGVIKKSGDNSKFFTFERGYSEYRLNRINDALKTLEEADQNDIKIKELLAQVLYRAERFEESFNVLRQVIRDSQDEYGEERATNLLAISAAASCFQNKNIEVDVPDSIYEASYNLACYYLGRHDYEAALEMLDEAEKKAKAQVEEDPEATEEDIDEELAPIRVQRAYIYQILEREKEANEIYHAASKLRINDPALLAVTANNMICLNREQNIFDSRKRIKMTSTEKLEAKLLSNQLMEIQLNQALFYWHTNQLDACRSKLKSLTSQYPYSPRVALLNAVQMLKEKKQTITASKMLEQYWSESGSEICNSAEAGWIDISEDMKKLSLIDSTASAAGHAAAELLCIPMTMLQLTLAHQDASTAIGSGSGGKTVQSHNSIVSSESFSKKIQDATRMFESALTINNTVNQLSQLPGVVGLRVALALLCDLTAGAQTTGGSSNEGRVTTGRFGVKGVCTAREILETALKENEASLFGGIFYSQLLEACSQTLLRLGCAPEAAELFEQQLALFDAEQQKNKRKTKEEEESMRRNRSGLVARLVEACSRFDANKAAKVATKNAEFMAKSSSKKSSDNLLEEEIGLSEADTDALESAFLFGAKYLKRMNKNQQQTPGEGDNMGVDTHALANASNARNANAERRREKARQKRRRQRKLPAGAQPGTLPDPERWLPRRERQHGRGKRSGRDKRAEAARGLARGPQGSTAGGTEWDASGKSPNTESTHGAGKQEVAGAQASVNKPQQQYPRKSGKNKRR